jgi:hypothetical protein
MAAGLPPPRPVSGLGHIFPLLSVKNFSVFLTGVPCAIPLCTVPSAGEEPMSRPKRE